MPLAPDPQEYFTIRIVHPHYMVFDKWMISKDGGFPILVVRRKAMKQLYIVIVTIGIVVLAACATDSDAGKLSSLNAEIHQYRRIDYNRYLEHPYYESVRSKPEFAELIGKAKEQALGENHERSVISIDAVVEEDAFAAGERGWRYGDGFLINFFPRTDSNDIYSDAYNSFGISMEFGEAKSILVNRDGTWFPGSSNNLCPRIELHAGSMTARYNVSIPWSAIYPFHPLKGDAAGINIRYRSKNPDGSIKELIYVSDWHQETTVLRRFAPLHFSESERSESNMVGTLGARVVATNTTSCKLVFWEPTARNALLDVTVTNEDGVAVSSTKSELSLPSGRHSISVDVPIPEKPGIYTVTSFLDGAETWRDDLWKYDKDEIHAIRESITRFSVGLSTNAYRTAAETALQNSVDAIEYFLDRFLLRLGGFDDRDDPTGLHRELDTVNAMVDRCASTGSIYSVDGYIESVFRSNSDGTLQPFSICLPAGFSPDQTYPLIVALHGSGVNEVGFVQWNAANTFGDQEAILIAPRGRDLSDWFTGASGEDIVDLIELARNMFPISKTICYGFSAGGYGTWRTAFLHPEAIDAAIVVSGYPKCPPFDTKENDMRNYIGRAMELPFLVIHGAEDPQLSVETTDGFVNRLARKGYAVRYEKIPSGGHTNIQVRSLVNAWLEETFPSAQSQRANNHDLAMEEIHVDHVKSATSSASNNQGEKS